MAEGVTWWVECGAKLEDRFIRNHVCRLGQESRYFEKHGNRGVFRTVYQYDDKEIRDANMIGDLCLDFDIDLEGAQDQELAYAEIRKDVLRMTKLLHKAYDIPPDMIRYYFSGAKGIHMQVPHEIFGIRPQPNLHLIWKQLAIELRTQCGAMNLDMKIYDKVRLFRVENSIHNKTGLYKIPLTAFEAATMPLADVRELAAAARTLETAQPEFRHRAKDMVHMAATIIENLTRPRDYKAVEWHGEIGYYPPCIRYLIDNPPQSGSRNDSMATIASFFRQNAMPLEMAEEYLYDWGKACFPPMEDSEIKTTVNSIYKSESRMGCSRAQQVSVCTPATCRMHKREL